MITNDKRITSSSSALLIRNATAVHSGNYICFAGFPPTLMMVGPALNITTATFWPTSNNANLSTSFSSSGSPRSVRSIMRYKMAKSLVKVADVGDLNRFASLSSFSSDVTSLETQNLFYRYFWRNHWARAATIFIVIAILMLLIDKLIGYTNFHLYENYPSNTTCIIAPPPNSITLPRGVISNSDGFSTHHGLRLYSSPEPPGANIIMTNMNSHPDNFHNNNNQPNVLALDTR